MGITLDNDDLIPKELDLRVQGVTYSSTISNMNACALWRLSAPDITPQDAGRAQVARGEPKAMEKVNQDIRGI